MNDYDYCTRKEAKAYVDCGVSFVFFMAMVVLAAAILFAGVLYKRVDALEQQIKQLQLEKAEENPEDSGKGH